mmetsp:Transcript_25917/g.56873  ORF Transcript_25917/g.56873 Transcript_25917/m.56873 type:complete len:291 (-) Transcript_25917:1349-2221(-)
MAFVFAAHHKEATFQKHGCLSVRQSVLDKSRQRTAPGPIYNPKPRISSKEKSLRNIKFGTGPARYNDEPENIKRKVPKTREDPGPCTYDPDAIRTAAYKISKHRNVAGIKFGTGKRMEDSKRESPSPAEYDPEAIRRGIMKSKSGMTSIKFGQARTNVKANTVPGIGPQTYDPEAIRHGIMRTKSSMPSVKFGAPPGKEKSRKSRNSIAHRMPGPQQYETESIRKGVYSLSTKRRPAGVKFTTGPRTYNDAEERERASKPGPMAYRIPSAMGRQVNSKYKSQPSVSFGAR